MYEVYIEKTAENDLKRLPTITFHGIISKIKFQIISNRKLKKQDKIDV